MVVGAIVSFVVSLLVGALAIYLAGALIADVRDYEHAIVTALVGAVVWFVTALLFGWIPLLGPLLVLLAYLWVIKSRYPGGWVDAGLIAVTAWVASVILLSVLSGLDIITDAIGIPFV